jgi:hypothetical protein
MLVKFSLLFPLATLALPLLLHDHLKGTFEEELENASYESKAKDPLMFRPLPSGRSGPPIHPTFTSPAAVFTDDAKLPDVSVNENTENNSSEKTKSDGFPLGRPGSGHHRTSKYFREMEPSHTLFRGIFKHLDVTGLDSSVSKKRDNPLSSAVWDSFLVSLIEVHLKWQN